MSDVTSDTASDLPIHIDDAVPVPARRGRRTGAPVKYPFDSLEVGQSFALPDAAGRAARKAMYAANRRAKQTRFQAGLDVEASTAEVKVYRIWRIA